MISEYIFESIFQPCNNAPFQCPPAPTPPARSGGPRPPPRKARYLPAREGAATLLPTSSPRLWVGTNAKAVNAPSLRASFAPKSHLSATRRCRGTPFSPEHGGRGGALVGTPRPSPRGRLGEPFPGVTTAGSPAAAGGSRAPALPPLPPRLGGAEVPEPRLPAPPDREREGAAGGAETAPSQAGPRCQLPPKTPLSPPGAAPPRHDQGESQGLGRTGVCRHPGGSRGPRRPGHNALPGGRGAPPPLTRGRSCSWGTAASRGSRGNGAACAPRCGR